MAAHEPRLLLAEWACLGVLYQGPSHGFAVAARLRPSGDIGRVWSVTRPLTYRALDQLVGHEYATVVGEEPGIAGGNRTVLAATRRGRSRFRRWLDSPVEHLRDVRTELLLKLVLAGQCGIDVAPMLTRQRELAAAIADALGADIVASATAAPDTVDVVALWRRESAATVVRFLDALHG